MGIVHFGIGAFHRAHQAWYTDRAMDHGDRNWAITGVSLRSRTVACQMNPQDGLYTVTERSPGNDLTRVVGAVRHVIPANRARYRVENLLAASSTRIASFTVTEKGYCRAPDGSLDPDLADDNSIYAFLAAGLHRRRVAGLPGLTLLSCDNLAANGAQLRHLLGEYLDRRDPGLRAWFERECTCPSTMVDRIVPSVTESDLRVVASRLGLEDAAAVVTETFSQWIIEDSFAAGRPRWHEVGADLVHDVAPYETAKLRMLNGAHSLLAYLGLAAGHTFVDQAVADPAIRPLVERLMREEALPSVTAAPGQNLRVYADALLARFANPALRHKLAQIAMDGSQKIPQRWLETLTWHRRAGRTCPAILSGIGAWLRHVRGDNGAVDDPLADQLQRAWAEAGEAEIVAAVFGRLIASHDWAMSSADQRIIAEQIGRGP
ncbi:MAG: mannitol dehydrogenase family protein [Rhizorhabdus sp.]